MLELEGRKSQGRTIPPAQALWPDASCLHLTLLLTLATEMLRPRVGFLKPPFSCPAGLFHLHRLGVSRPYANAQNGNRIRVAGRRGRGGCQANAPPAAAGGLHSHSCAGGRRDWPSRSSGHGVVPRERPAGLDARRGSQRLRDLAEVWLSRRRAHGEKPGRADPAPRRAFLCRRRRMGR